MRKLSLVLALAATTLATLPRTALAAEDQAEASPTGKGITGGALLGGEAVMLTEAALKVKPWWAYALGGVAGGIAGGVGGYGSTRTCPKAEIVPLTADAGDLLDDDVLGLLPARLAKDRRVEAPFGLADVPLQDVGHVLAH